MSERDSQALKRLSSLPLPEHTSLRHSIRWILTGERFLDCADQLAIGDLPDISAPEFDAAKSELVLALRKGLISSFGELLVFDETCATYIKQFYAPKDEWDDYLKQYEHYPKSEFGVGFIGRVPIPPELWNSHAIHWDIDKLSNNQGRIQSCFHSIQVCTTDLSSAFEPSARGPNQSARWIEKPLSTKKRRVC